MGIRKTSALTLLTWTLFFLCLPQISCGQASSPSVNKPQALQTVKVKAAEGWKEVISDEGRFRVLFPREPILVNGGGAEGNGYKFYGDDANWFVLYGDFAQPTTDEAQLRDAYHKSAERISKKGAKVLRQNDIVLNGRLGTELVIQGPNAMSYMRAFLIGRRMYTVAVDSKKAVDGDSTLPKDVQQFFDSFTFWE